MRYEVAKIGDFAKVKGGKRLPTGADLLDEATEHPYIRVTDMLTDGLEASQVKFIDHQTHDAISRYIITTDDVYISIAGTIGRVGIVPDSLNMANLTENAAKITEIDDSFNHRFLMYFLRGHLGQGQIAAKTGGTSQPKLALYRIEEIECPRVPRDIQNSIVDVALDYDLLIANNRRRIQLLEESARLLYQEWFVHLRFPGHEQINTADGVPEGWTKEPLENLLTLQRGFDLPVSKRLGGSVPIYASTGVNGFHNTPKVKGPGVVTGRSGTLGRVMFIAQDFWPLNTTLWVKEFKKVSPIFATYLLRAMKLEGYNGGAAVPTLNRNDIHKVDVLCPDQKLMSEFEKQTSVVFQQIDKLKEYNQKLAQARDLLLPKLMSGELAV